MYRKSLIIALAIFTITWTGVRCYSLLAYKSYQAPNTLDDMSPAEETITGLTKLNSEEKKALQSWINKRYSPLTAQSIADQDSDNYPTISEILGNGSYVRLSDNSLWKIHPNDTAISYAWVTPVEIIVEQTGTGPYPFTLTNTLTQSVVRAQAATSLPQYLIRTPNPPPPQPKATQKKPGAPVQPVPQPQILEIPAQ